MSADQTPAVGTPLPPKTVTIEVIEEGVRRLLVGLDQDAKTEVMQNTPRRVAEMLAEVINAPWCDIEIPWKCFENPGIDDLIVVTDCHYISFCEHHLMPSVGIAHVGYVPDKLITGYSKLKKALNYLARQPQLNERLVVDTLTTAEKVLQPKGVALITSSIHTCLICKANAPATEIVTIEGFRGVLREEPYQGRFMQHVYGRRPVFGA